MSARIVSGIYQIRNTVNGKVYVGSAVSMQLRFNQHRHKLRHGIHQPYLQNAWVKHGESMFEFACLEVVARKEHLIEREQVWLDMLKPWDRDRGYNISPIAGRPLGFRHTDTAKAAISQALRHRKRAPHSDEAKARISAWQKGKKRGPLSDATKAKISLAHKGRVHTEAARLNMILGQKNRPVVSAETRAKMSRPMPDSTRAAIRAANVGRHVNHETKARLSLANKGRKVSDETRAKLSLAKTGKKRGPHSEVHKAHLSLAHKKLWAERGTA